MEKKTLFLFNPDHDMALANHDPNYMPPASVRRFAADMAVFPVWYAGEGAMVLAPSAYNREFLAESRKYFPGLPDLLTESEIATTPGLDFSPWGWDAAVYKRLIQLGASPEALPAQEKLDAIREKSHRLQAVELLKKLQFAHCCGESHYLTELEELEAFVTSRDYCVLKVPLSGSGKGLNWCKGLFTTHIRGWCNNVIRQQGGVVAEPCFDKEKDFAMQFYAAPDGVVRFAGYSLFATESTGAYTGNLLASNAEIKRRLTEFVPSSVLDEVRSALERELTHLLAGAYVGYLGVDMMICRFEEEPAYRLHPCVEVNLRLTMGMVARLFFDAFVHPDKVGMLNVGYSPTNEALRKTNCQQAEMYPLKIEDGRITEGYLSLIPVTPHSLYSCTASLSLP